jgi:hypothetical protein
MKVYPGQHSKGSKERNFNRRICRSPRVVENVFGLASSILRVIRKPVLLEPENALLVLMTIVCLQNLIRFNNLNNLIKFNKFNSAAIFTPPSTFDYE